MKNQQETLKQNHKILLIVIAIAIAMCFAAFLFTATAQSNPYATKLTGHTLAEPDTIPCLILVGITDEDGPTWSIRGYMIQMPNESHAYFDSDMKPLDRKFFVWMVRTFYRKKT